MGSHQPPTNRSFYLSLAASTLRFAIIVALVIGGIVVIDQAFPALSSDDGGGTTAPITGGTVVFRTHVHELPSGLFRVIDVGVNRGVTATDEE